MQSARVVLDCLSKAMVAVAVMLAISIALLNPPLETPARGTAATLLALGILGLGVVHLPAHRSAHRR